MFSHISLIRRTYRELLLAKNLKCKFHIAVVQAITACIVKALALNTTSYRHIFHIEQRCHFCLKPRFTYRRQQVRQFLNYPKVMRLAKNGLHEFRAGLATN